MLLIFIFLEPNQWTGWSDWESCSNNCGTGRQIRTRHCPGDQSLNLDGGTCDGSSIEERPCFDLSICSIWTDWSEWSGCSDQCGSLKKYRERLCIGNNCEGPRKEEKSCDQLEKCSHLSKEWSEWSSWSKCSVNCGSGFRKRARKCIGNSCEGSTIEEESCEQAKCYMNKG